MWRSRLLYAGTFAAALVLIAWYEDKRVGYTLLYALLLLALFSLATVLGAPALVRVEEETDTDALIKNDRLVYQVRIVNRGLFFYPRMETVYHNRALFSYAGDDEVCLLQPRQTITRGYTMVLPYRGSYRVGVESIAVTDLLGLFRRRLSVREGPSVTVYPRSDREFVWSLRKEPQNRARYNDLFQEDYSTVADVRKYTSSDSLRKIHWKLSAKRGELIVKSFQTYEPGHVALLLDTRPVPAQDMQERAAFEDKMISYAAAAVDCCITAGFVAELLFGVREDERMRILPEDGPELVLDCLARLPFTGEAAVMGLAQALPGPYSLLLFLSDIDESVTTEIHSLVCLDHSVTLYHFYSGEQPLDAERKALLAGLKALGVDVNPVQIGGA